MISIAIDGPASAGKSTIAQRAAKELGFIYVDTGALYRAIGLFAQENKIPNTNEAALAPRLGEIEIELKFEDGHQLIFLNGRNVTKDIRSPQMGMAASNVSALPAVRAFLLGLQRDLAKKYNLIMDGRDIGTVVLPGADLKIFLTATPEDRAMRRYMEFVTRGERIRYEEVLRDLRVRDENDSTRAAAPLKQADDAILLDTTGNELEESIALVLKIIRERGIG